MHLKHDSAYRDFFSNKSVVEDLLKAYVDQDWVEQLDFSSLQRVNASYVHDAEHQRASDVVWRLRLQGSDDWVYLYLLLEFQSTVDEHMALRMSVYTGLLYQDLIKQGAIQRGQKLPPVFPLVIYNGAQAWNATMNLRDLIAPVPAELAQYLPNIRYAILDLGRVQKLAPDNTVSTIIELETAGDGKQLALILERARVLLEAPENYEFQRALVAWLQAVVLKRVSPEEDFPKFRQLNEVRTMLAERVTQWTEDLLEEGRQVGLQEGVQIGREEGREEGREVGLEEGLQKAALALARRNFTVAEIAAELEVSQEVVERMLQQQ